MNATDYTPLARRTMKELETREQHLVHMALGLTGEFGEFIDAIKKNAIYGKDLDTTNLTEEMGDSFWYFAGLLPELGVSPAVMQRSLDLGLAHGIKLQAQATEMGQNSPFDFARALLAFNGQVATISASLANAPSEYLPSSSNAVSVVETLGTIFGMLCGIYQIDPAQSMYLNIAKLAKRYGDKYSDLAALSRNLDAERAVLEG